MRPSAVSATSPAASHLPVLRQRPSGTSVYKITTSPAAKKVTCSDGIAQPPQPVRMATPNGRGRWAIGPTTALGDQGQQLREDHHDDQMPEAS